MLQAFRMYLPPKMDNGNITSQLLVSLGLASGTNFTSGIYSLINYILLSRLVNRITMRV